MFGKIHRTLAKEVGTFDLSPQHRTAFEKVANFLLASKNVIHVLDGIELTFHSLDTIVREVPECIYNTRQTPDDAIAELNARFLEHGVGYQYESGRIIRIDSQIIHAEVVKPALKLLGGKEYEGANQEFLSAHEHYRHQRYKECLVECLKAFESTMKVICSKRQWVYNPTDTASKLLGVLFSNNLIPPYLQSHFTAVRKTLEDGVPPVRNKQGAHGQGSQPVVVPDYLAAYALHLTATNIVFLVEAEKAKK